MSAQPWSKLWHEITRAGYVAKMGGPAAQLYMALLSYTSNDMRPVWPSATRLQKDTGLSRRSIFRALDALEGLGLIQRTLRSSRNGSKDSTQYTFVHPGATPDTRGGVTRGTRGSVTSGGGVVSPEALPIGNKNYRTTTTTLKVVVQEPVAPLDEVVVAVLKRLGIHEEDWPKVRGMDPYKVKALGSYCLREATKNPGGLFSTLLKRGWQIPQDDPLAFEYECDMLRASKTHAISKATGKAYPILKDRPGLVLETPKGDHRVADGKELAGFTWSDRVA